MCSVDNTPSFVTASFTLSLRLLTVTKPGNYCMLLNCHLLPESGLGCVKFDFKGVGFIRLERVPDLFFLKASLILSLIPSY